MLGNGVRERAAVSSRSFERFAWFSGLVVAWLAAGQLGCGAIDPRTPHVLLVTLDTTRVDHLSTYGYERETSPHLDAFSNRAVRFTRAWSTSAWTLPAHASLFTSLYPSAHGAQYEVRGEALGGFNARALDEEFVTLAELLAARGYQTAAFVGGPWMRRGFGLMQGFETIDDEVPSMSGRSGDELTDRALRWLQSSTAHEPLFLFVNYFDPHYPYEPPRSFNAFSRERINPPNSWLDAALAGQSPSAEVRDALIARYDDEIAAMDHQLGRLLDAWRERTGSEPALVTVTADHGESFGEEGFYLHNGSVGEEVIRIPLLIRYPDGRGAGTLDDRPVQLVDLLPIVASAVDIELPSEVQGVLPGGRQRAYLELLRNPFRVKRFGARYDHDLEALIDWPYKLVSADLDAATLYRVDGALSRPVRALDTSSVESLVAELGAHRERVGVAQSVGRAELDEETLESLRALGYLD